MRVGVLEPFLAAFFLVVRTSTTVHRTPVPVLEHHNKVWKRVDFTYESVSDITGSI